jgi:hypothetical protein
MRSHHADVEKNFLEYIYLYIYSNSVDDLTSGFRRHYRVGHRQSDDSPQRQSLHSPIHGTDPNSGRAERTVAITPRFASAPKQSRDMTLGEGVGKPRCSGTDAEHPRLAASTVRALNRARLGMGAVASLHDSCRVGSMVAARMRRTTARRGRVGRNRWVHRENPRGGGALLGYERILAGCVSPRRARQRAGREDETRGTVNTCRVSTDICPC